jgi:hypothetical protein
MCFSISIFQKKICSETIKWNVVLKAFSLYAQDWNQMRECVYEKQRFYPPPFSLLSASAEEMVFLNLFFRDFYRGVLISFCTPRVPRGWDEILKDGFGGDLEVLPFRCI